MRGRGRVDVTARGLAQQSAPAMRGRAVRARHAAETTAQADGATRAPLPSFPGFRDRACRAPAIVLAGFLRSRSPGFCTVLPPMLRITHHIERPASDSARRAIVFPGRMKARPKQTESSATLGTRPCSPRPRPYRTTGRYARSRPAWSPCRRRDRLNYGTLPNRHLAAWTRLRSRAITTPSD